MSPTFTVVCVYNSEETLQRYLLAGLARQRSPFELKLVDNQTRRYPSAAAALNHGASGATTDYLVFIHQDVELLSPDFFAEASRLLTSIPDLGIAGIVGATARNGVRELRGKCLQGDVSAAGFSPGYEGPLAVQTVDEQLMFIPTAVFHRAPFDAIACPAWDLYGVEYALRCRKQGRSVAVLPLAVRHASWGKLRWSYFETLSLVQRKHPDVQTLFTTCGTWSSRRAPLGHWVAHRIYAGRGRLARLGKARSS